MNDYMEREIGMAIESLPAAMPRGEYGYVIRFPGPRGERILDVGSGACDCVYWLNSEGAEAYGVDVRYVDLDILRNDMEISFERSRKKLGNKGTESERLAYCMSMQQSKRNFMDDIRLNPTHYYAALAGYLPFATNTFDFVFSINCITHGMDQDTDVLNATVLESLRVLRHDGELQLYPFLGVLDRRQRKNQNGLLRFLNAQHISTRVEDVSRTYQRLHVTKP